MVLRRFVSTLRLNISSVRKLIPLSITTRKTVISNSQERFFSSILIVQKLPLKLKRSKKSCNNLIRTLKNAKVVMSLGMLLAQIDLGTKTF